MRELGRTPACCRSSWRTCRWNTQQAARQGSITEAQLKPDSGQWMAERGHPRDRPWRCPRWGAGTAGRTRLMAVAVRERHVNENTLQQATRDMLDCLA